MKLYIWGFFQNLSRKFKFHWNLARVTDTLHEDVYTFMIISSQLLLRMRNASDKFVEKIKTHILCSITFFRKSCRLWDNVEKYGRTRQATDDNIIRRMCFACWVTKATNTHSEYIVLIHGNNGYANAPQCYGIRTLSVLFTSTTETVRLGKEWLSEILVNILPIFAILALAWIQIDDLCYFIIL
jgi:hypothetical protein